MRRESFIEVASVSMNRSPDAYTLGYLYYVEQYNTKLIGDNNKKLLWLHRHYYVQTKNQLICVLAEESAAVDA